MDCHHDGLRATQLCAACGEQMKEVAAVPSMVGPPGRWGIYLCPYCENVDARFNATPAGEQAFHCALKFDT
jgi:transposase